MLNSLITRQVNKLPKSLLHNQITLLFFFIETLLLKNKNQNKKN